MADLGWVSTGSRAHGEAYEARTVYDSDAVATLCTAARPQVVSCSYSLLFCSPTARALHVAPVHTMYTTRFCMSRERNFAPLPIHPLLNHPLVWIRTLVAHGIGYCVGACKGSRRKV